MPKYITTLLASSILLCSACSNSSSSTDGGVNEDVSDVVSGVFYDDDGKNCVVFVSDERADGATEADAKDIILSRLQEEEFEVCDGSRPKSAGLYTIVGLDEYEQPDWSSSTEHYFFKIKGWSKLKKACSDETKVEDCAAMTQTILFTKAK